MQVNRENCGDPADAGIAPGKYAPVPGTITDRDNPLRVRRSVIRALEPLPHVGGDWTRYEQHVGMARRGDEPDSEALQVVHDVVESMYFQLAAIAGPGIDLSDGQRATQSPPGRAVEPRGKFLHRGFVF